MYASPYDGDMKTDDSAQPTGTYTVSVRNFKDDPTGEAVSLHGSFATAAEGEQFANAVANEFGDFMSADVVTILPATLHDVVAAHGLGDSFLPTSDTPIGLGSVVYDVMGSPANESDRGIVYSITDGGYSVIWNGDVTPKFAAANEVAIVSANAAR